MENLNRDVIPFSFSGGGDIKLSTWEYYDFIDKMLDDRVSATALMKFKRLHSFITYNCVAVPIVTFPFAWFFSRWLVGFIDRGMGNSRYNLVGMSIFYPAFLYLGYTKPIGRKLYTDLLASNDDDGTYIRETLRTHNPGLWSNISAQLNSKNFTFPQMNEFKGQEFSKGFVNSSLL